MSIAAAASYSRHDDTAGLWYATDTANENILPLSSVEACYYVMGTSDVTIIVA